MVENEQDSPLDQPQADEDWKSEVEAEKQSQAAEKEGGSEDQASDESASQQSAATGVPPASLTTLVSLLATQAMVALGQGIPGQEESPTVQLDLARYHIDTLAVLEEKTQGNASDEEAGLLQQSLSQLRMMYVAVQQQAD